MKVKKFVAAFYIFGYLLQARIESGDEVYIYIYPKFGE
jgi:hypothetical protein